MMVKGVECGVYYRVKGVGLGSVVRVRGRGEAEPHGRHRAVLCMTVFIDMCTRHGGFPA